MMYKEFLRKHIGKKCEINQGQNYAGCEITISSDGVHEIIAVTDEYVVLSEPIYEVKATSPRFYRVYLIENISLITDIKP